MCLKTLHASRSEIMRKLSLPSSLPFLFAAARICMPLSLIGAVVGRIRSGRDRERTGNAHRHRSIPRRSEDHLRLGLRPLRHGGRAVLYGRSGPEPGVDLAPICSVSKGRYETCTTCDRRSPVFLLNTVLWYKRSRMNRRRN